MSQWGWTQVRHSNPWYISEENAIHPLISSSMPKLYQRWWSSQSCQQVIQMFFCFHYALMLVMFYFFSPDVQFESAWALITNIASVMSDQNNSCCKCCSCGRIHFCFGLTSSSCGWTSCLGPSNIACDGPELLDHLIEKSIIEPLLHFITPDALVNLFDIFIEWC